jgi:tetratricopeptide (TPR) repeat protein/O-antigen ligase
MSQKNRRKHPPKTFQPTGPAPREPLLAESLCLAVYAVALVPLIIFSQFLAPFHFGKVMVFRSGVEIMAVMYVWLVWQDRSYLPKPTLILWGCVAFALSFTAATVASVNPYISFWGTLERMGGLWTFWHYVIFFLIAVGVLRTRMQWRRMLRTTAMGGLLAGLYAVLQRADAPFVLGAGGRSGRIFGTVGNEALFAGYEIVCLFLALALFVDRLKNGSGIRSNLDRGRGYLWAAVGPCTAVLSYMLFCKMTWKLPAETEVHPLAGAIPFLIPLFWGVYKTVRDAEEAAWLPAALLLELIAIVLTVVRGSYLGVVVGAFVFIGLYHLRYPSRLTRNALLTMSALAAACLIILATPIRHSDLVRQSTIVRRVTETSLQEYSGQTRYLAWKIGLAGWRETPKTLLLGWGPETFNVPFSKRFNPYFYNSFEAETFYDRAHNMFVEVLVTMGLLGLVAYLSLYWGVVTAALKIRGRPADAVFGIGLLSLVVAYAIHNFFIFDTSASFIVFFITLGFASFLIAPTRQETPRPCLFATFRLPVVGLLAVAVAVLVWQTNVRPSLANYGMTRAIVKTWRGDFNGAVQAFRDAIAYDVPGKYEYRHRFAQYVIDALENAKITPEQEQVVRVAIREVQKNADESPMDYLPLFHLSRLHIMLGKDNPTSPSNDEAIKYSQAVLKISPTFVRTYYELAQAYLNKKEFDRAVECFRKAAELNPKVGVSFWYWGMAELQRGHSTEGLRLIDEAVAKGYALKEGEYLRLAVALDKLGENARLVEIFETLTKMAPTNAEHHLNLANVYARVGKKDLAVAEARKAAQLDPKLEPKLREFVQQLGGQW